MAIVIQEKKASGLEPMLILPGMWLRMTRNLDKERGYCNGALGVIQDVLMLYPHPICTVRLTHGCMILLHPIKDGDHNCLPCVYGYALTTRKA